jgi:hypothetical protein
MKVLSLLFLPRLDCAAREASKNDDIKCEKYHDEGTKCKMIYESRDKFLHMNINHGGYFELELRRMEERNY